MAMAAASLLVVDLEVVAVEQGGPAIVGAGADVDVVRVEVGLLAALDGVARVLDIASVAARVY